MAVFSEQTHQVVSPEAVRISVSLRKRQQDRYPVCSLCKMSWISMFIYKNGWRKKLWVSRSPVCASSSLRVLGLAALTLYTVQMLSKPPLATRLPEGAKATLITQADFNGTATSCEQESLKFRKTATSNKYILTLKSAAKMFKFELGFHDKMPSEVVEERKSDKQWTWYEIWVDVVFCLKIKISARCTQYTSKCYFRLQN